jgi:tetratricopeptide (TPR) repeat protein
VSAPRAARGHLGRRRRRCVSVIVNLPNHNGARRPQTSQCHGSGTPLTLGPPFNNCLYTFLVCYNISRRMAECIICLETSPNPDPPIPLGCGCRGGAGFAHVGCIVEWTASRAAPIGNKALTGESAQIEDTALIGDRRVWAQCQTCSRNFTGAMRIGLSYAWWLRVRDQAEESEERLASALNRASALCGQGNYAEAETIQRMVLAVQTRVFGSRHASTLYTMNNLANCIMDQGRHAEAEELQRTAIDEHTRAILETGGVVPESLAGKESLARSLLAQVGTMNNQADALMGQGKYVEAELLLRHELVRRMQVIRPECHGTMASLQNLAVCLMKGRKQYAEAEKLLQEVLALNRRVLGAEHPDTLLCTHNLANCISKQKGRGVEATRLYREVLDVKVRILGREHPSTDKTANNLSRRFFDSGEYAEAEKIYRDQLRVQTRVLGAEHPNTQENTAALAVCLAQQGKYTEAEPMLQAVLTSSRRIFGPNHIRTIEVREDLDMLRTIHPVERGEERGRLRAKADAKKLRKPVAKTAPSAEAEVKARVPEEELPAMLELLWCFCVLCMIAGWWTSVGKPGADGKAGPAGKDGKDGKDGDALMLRL